MQSQKQIKKKQIQCQEEEKNQLELQTIPSQEEINEEILLNIIEKVKSLLVTFDEYQQQNWQVVMLVGDTANGKSTIFNYLCGYELTIKEIIKGIKVLDLKNPNQDGASKMKGGQESVTKEPNYYFNQNNKHILIDFPGFKDSKGLFQQQVIQILFNRMVIKNPIKIVYVVKQNDNVMIQRGDELSTFINNCFAQNNQEFHKVTLILNQYMEDLSDNELIAYLQTDFNIIKDNKDIAVIRKIKTNDDLQMYFNNDHKNKIWKMIVNSQPIQFQTVWMEKNTKIADFINDKCILITIQIVDQINKSIDNDLKNLSIEEIQNLVQHYNTIGLLSNKNPVWYDNIYQWYYDLINICKWIAEIFKCGQVLKKQISDLLKIFQFFAQKENIINTKIILQENSDYIKKELLSKEQTIRQALLTRQRNDRSNCNLI